MGTLKLINLDAVYPFPEKCHLNKITRSLSRACFFLFQSDTSDSLIVSTPVDVTDLNGICLSHSGRQVFLGTLFLETSSIVYIDLFRSFSLVAYIVSSVRLGRQRRFFFSQFATPEGSSLSFLPRNRFACVIYLCVSRFSSSVRARTSSVLINCSRTERNAC